MRKLIFLYFILYCSTAICQDLPVAMEALAPLQSVYDDSHPVISANGKSIYFSRKGHPQNMGKNDHFDIWVAFRQSDSQWSKAVNMPAPLNNKKDNFVIASSLDGLTLFLNDAYLNAESGLVYTKKKGRSWSRPLPVDIQNFQKIGQVSFSMGDNGTVLLLTQNTSAGYGGRDIYIANQIDEQTWSEPINLGANINSSREEFHACLAADNKTIYFLSNGFSSPWLLTLMISQRIDDDWTNWTEPVSTGIELDPSLFNTHFSIEPDGSYFYCAGFLEDKDDKHLFKIPIPERYQPEPTALVVGELIDVETGANLEGKVMLHSLMSNGESVQQSTNRGGRFQFVLPYQKQFALSAEVPGYFAKSETIADRSLQELDKESDQNNTGNTIRVSPKAEELQVRLQQLNKSMLDLSQRKEAIKLTTDNRPLTRMVPKGNDAQLNALKQKYYKALGVETIVQEKTISSGDSELDEMKRAFRKHNNVRQEQSKNKTKNQVPPSDETQLEAMKRKYNEANNNSSTKNREEELVVASVAEMPYSFSELVDQSRVNLESELSERVVKELKADLLQEVSFKMHAEMDSEARNAYAGTLQKKTGMLEADLRKELRKKYRAEVKRELRGELLEVVEEELRILLREEVKRELRESLKEEVREELRLELEYLLTKEMAKDVQKELNGLLKQLKKESESAPANYYKEEDIQTKGVLAGKGQQKINLQLYPLKTGSIIPLDNILFKANSPSWKESALPELDRVYNLLINNPELQIEISGHTNGWCSTEFANELSNGRAKAVAEYLYKKDIEQDRVAWKGYGKTQPLVPNDSVENCKKNQRLELKIL